MSAQAEAAPVVWHIPDEAHEVQRVTLRGARYVILEEDCIPELGIDLQVGDVLVLWSGPGIGEGRGIAVKLLHDEQLLNRKNVAVWRVFQISEPMDARLISDEGAEETEQSPAPTTNCIAPAGHEWGTDDRCIWCGRSKSLVLAVEDNDGD